MERTRSVRTGHRSQGPSSDTIEMVLSGVRLSSVSTPSRRPASPRSARKSSTTRGHEDNASAIATGERDADGTIRLKTAPEALTPDDPLYELGPGEKGCVFETDVMGTISARSSKGGPLATAACVIKDVLNIAAPPGL